MKNSSVCAPDTNKKKLIARMGGCYAFGTFTDNFYKQTAILLAASLTFPEMQSLATVLYSLPFILCSAWAGWLSDKIVKKHIVVLAKIVEFFALLLGVFALTYEVWAGILLVVFLMGLQCTAFSPALNGSIPEIFTTAEVPKINSYLKLASTIAVLLGVATAGVIFDIRPDPWLVSLGFPQGQTFGLLTCGFLAVFVAFLGLVTAFFLVAHAPEQKRETARFPASGPIDSVKYFFECRRDPQLFLILLAEGFFYGTAAIATISVANLSAALGYTATCASMLSAAILLGVATGAIFAGRFDAYSWKKLLIPACIGMGFFIVLAAGTPYLPVFDFFVKDLPFSLVWFFMVLFGAGVCGGFYLIPVASFIQVRPNSYEKGKVIGISNFFSYVAIACFGIVFFPISKLSPEWTFFLYGIAQILFALLYLSPRIRLFNNMSA